MEKRLALVVGIAAYPNDPLANPVNDAVDIASKLTSFGFDVITNTDCTLSSLNTSLDEFEKRLDSYDAGLFFFAGHGVQLSGKNYLAVTDTDNSGERHARASSVCLDDILSIMNSSSASTSIVILDACRSNPWQRGWTRNGGQRGLAPVFAPKGTIIGYATSPGEDASDGQGKNGTYTAALLNHISEKDRPIEVIFKRVRNEVAAATNGSQTTWEHTSLSGEFYFDISIATAAGGYSPQACSDSNFVALQGSLAESTIEALKSYNWYTQNPAIDALTPLTIQSMTKDELFVIGRNILQSACGGAGSANQFIERAPVKLRGWPDIKRQAIYDGVLFEIFFGCDGALRKHIKGRHFDEVMAHKNAPSLAPSFDFITNCLNQAGAKLFVLPNQGRQLGVTITIDNSNENDLMKGIWIDGRDVMAIEDQTSNGHFGSHGKASPDHLKAILSETLMVPQTQIDLTFQPALRANDLAYPYGLTVA